MVVQGIEMDNSVLVDIEKERAYQNKRWGPDFDDKHNTPFHWGIYIANYATRWPWLIEDPAEFRKVLLEFRKRMVQVAALAIAAIESVDRQTRLH